MASLKENSRPIIILLAVFLILRLPLLLHNPLIQDEAVYSMMIEEQRIAPTIIPTFMGYAVGWKPILFFWLYSVLPVLPGPLELTYRLPSLLFALVTIIPLFLLLRNAGCSKAVAFITLLLFEVTYISSYPATSLLIDSMVFFQIALSLFLYSEESFGRWRFLAAGFLTFTAYLTKLVVAAMVPILAVAYFLFIGQKKTLREPMFLLSLLALPAAAIITFILFQSAGLGVEVYTTHIIHHLISADGLVDQMGRVWSSLSTLMVAAGILLSLSIVGFVKHWKDNRFMSVWYLLTIFPLLGSFFLPWYFLPVMPSICYFATLLLIKDRGKEKTDAFFTAFLALIIIITLAALLFLYHMNYNNFIAQKGAGLSVVGKDNVLFIGDWAPAAVSYKVISEIRSEGHARDFGWVLFINDTSNNTGASKDVYYDFMNDYYTDSHNVTQGNFDGLYFAKGIYRKDTNLTSFDYIVISDFHSKNSSKPIVSGATLIYNKSGMLVFKR